MNTSTQNGQIVSIRYYAEDLRMELQEAQNPNLYEPTLKAIHNAWEESAIIDQNGTVWIGIEKLHCILRTSSDSARYLSDSISDKYRQNIGGEQYIRGCEIFRLIDSAIQTARSESREEYIRFSELYYQFIRDSDKAQKARRDFYGRINKSRRKLKGKRVSEESIKTDELTGQELCTDAEFSHIRSVSIYPFLADQVWNGLVVNKDIHKIITKSAVNDERHLLELCEIHQWRTDWYLKFSSYVADYPG